MTILLINVIYNPCEGIHFFPSCKTFHQKNRKKIYCVDFFYVPKNWFLQVHLYCAQWLLSLHIVHWNHKTCLLYKESSVGTSSKAVGIFCNLALGCWQSSKANLHTLGKKLAKAKTLKIYFIVLCDNAWNH